ncbi:unnamed protein product [Meganyctiphanes norvegica]|uniref:Uncharacterized protein n=1 Tax=Meganyctiphanes norvegica TaxID=48144 RepID=A0AAV2RTQ4_MEGNR
MRIKISEMLRKWILIHLLVTTCLKRNKAVCHSYSDKEREEIAYRLQVYREEKLRKEIEEKSNSQRKNLNSNKEKLLQLWKRDQEYILAKRQQKELKDKITEDKQVQMSKLRLKSQLASSFN